MKIESISPPTGRRIMQITSSAGSGSTVLFALCDDGSVWCCSPFYLPSWQVVVTPPHATVV